MFLLHTSVLLISSIRRRLHSNWGSYYYIL